MNTSMMPSRDARTAEEHRRKLTLAERLALLYAASVPFNGLAIGGRSLPFLVGAVYLTLAILTRLASQNRERDELPIRRMLAAVVFTLYCTTSYYWSIAPDLTIGRVTTLFLLLLTSWFLAQDLSRVSRQLPVAFVIGAVLAAFMVLGAPASITDRRTANGNANDVALTLLLGVVCALWLSLKERGRSRLLGALALAILIVGVVATGSRTAVVGGAAMMLAVVGWLAWKQQWRPFVLVLGLFALGAAVFSILPADVIPSRLTTIQSSLELDSLGGRTYLWRAILERGLDMNGVGAGATPAYLQQTIGSPFVSHNAFLGVLLETGIVGILLFLAILLHAIIAARRSPYTELLFFMLPAMIAGSMALSIEGSRPLWFVIALAWAVQPHEPAGAAFGSTHREVGFGRAVQGARR